MRSSSRVSIGFWNVFPSIGRLQVSMDQLIRIKGDVLSQLLDLLLSFWDLCGEGLLKGLYHRLVS